MTENEEVKRFSSSLEEARAARDEAIKQVIADRQNVVGGASAINARCDQAIADILTKHDQSIENALRVFFSNLDICVT